MKDWYLYIIECRDGSLYTGVTMDVQRRFDEHLAQGAKSAKYLKGRGPLKLVFSALVGEKSKAYRLERKVKSLPALRKHDLVRGQMSILDI